MNLKKSHNNQKPAKKEAGFLLPYQLLRQSKKSALFLIFFIMAVGALVANMLALFFPLTLLQVYDKIIPNKALTTLAILVIVVAVAVIFESILRTCQGSLSQWLDTKFQYLYGLDIMKSITTMPTALYRSSGVGEYLEKLEQLQKIRNFYIGQAFTSVLNIPFLIVFILLMAYISYWVAIAVICLIVIVAFVLGLLVGDLRINYQEKLEQESRLSNFTINLLENIHYIKAQALEAQMLRRYEMLYKKNIELNSQEWKMHALQLIQLTGSQMMTVVIAAVAAPLAVSGQLTVGGMAACIILASRCLQPLNTAAQVWIRLQTVKVAQQELNQLINLPKEGQGLRKSIVPPFSFSFKHVSLQISDRKLFNDINLEVPARTCIAIRGNDSLSKSSLLRLLQGDYTNYQGSVSINGQEIKEVNLKDIRKHTTYLSRDYSLYQDTIIENITEYSAAKNEQALKIAEQLGLTDYVERLPEGFDTRLTENVILQLPRGIKQLISLTRGFARNSEIILFDEANVFLSLQADKRLISYLNRLKHKKTLIITSERPSLLAIADKVYQIKDCKLEEVSNA